MFTHPGGHLVSTQFKAFRDESTRGKRYWEQPEEQTYILLRLSYSDSIFVRVRRACVRSSCVRACVRACVRRACTDICISFPT